MPVTLPKKRLVSQILFYIPNTFYTIMRVRNFRSLTFIMHMPLFINPVQATKPMRKDRVSLVPSRTGTSMTALKESLKLSDAFSRFPSALPVAAI